MGVSGPLDAPDSPFAIFLLPLCPSTLNFFTNFNSVKQKYYFLEKEWLCRGKKCNFIASAIGGTAVLFQPYCEAEGDWDRNKLWETRLHNVLSLLPLCTLASVWLCSGNWGIIWLNANHLESCCRFSGRLDSWCGCLHGCTSASHSAWKEGNRIRQSGLLSVETTWFS